MADKRRHLAILTAEDVVLIREAYGNPMPCGTKGRFVSPYPGVSHRTLAVKFEVHYRTIQKIITFQTWKNL